MAIGLSEAAAATGVNRSTIYRAWKAGRISATRTDSRLRPSSAKQGLLMVNFPYLSHPRQF